MAIKTRMSTAGSIKTKGKQLTDHEANSSSVGVLEGVAERSPLRANQASHDTLVVAKELEEIVNTGFIEHKLWHFTYQHTKSCSDC